MLERTTVNAMIHLYGPSKYHCDQSGDCATIRIGESTNTTLTASAKDFLLLAKTCKEAAEQICKKGFVKLEKEVEQGEE